MTYRGDLSPVLVMLVGRESSLNLARKFEKLPRELDAFRTGLR